MPERMNSRERMLAALRRQEVDYIPCCCAFSVSMMGPEYSWAGRADTLDRIVNGLGLDALVGVSVGASWHPDVEVRVWTDRDPREPWPILHKEIMTPEGPLTAAVRITENWRHGNDIPLDSDWNVSRFVKPWLETMEDVELYRFVHMPPSPSSVAHARERFADQKKVADEFGVITYAACGMGLTSAIHLFGAQKGVVLSLDHPEVIDRFLEIEHEVTLKRAEVLADLGVDVICRNGCYENTDFWSPRQLKDLLVPRLRREIEAMHSGGAAVVYYICTGVMPILDLLADLDFDAYHQIEPVLGDQDIKLVAAKLCDRHAIWGGVSAPIHIGEGTTDIARQAVREAFRTFGPRGLVLKAVPSIRAQWPWENSLAMFDEWRCLREWSAQ